MIPHLFLPTLFRLDPPILAEKTFSLFSQSAPKEKGASCQEKVMGVAPEGYEFYRYNPNIGGAVVFVIAFGAATAYHGWRAWSYRAKFFIAFVLGGLRMPPPRSRKVL